MAALEQWAIQVGGPTNEELTTLLAQAEASHRKLWEVPLAWGVLIVLATLSTTVIAIHSVAQPTERLTRAADRLASGHLEERVPVEWADEFGRLATAFNTMAEQLERSHAELEQQVAERTADLARRNLQLETAARVARDAAAIRDVNRLLEQTAHLISDRFGFYHTGIFLLDEAKEYAVLQAASSEGGQRMLARGHRLKVGEQGIVGYVTARGEARIALDVGADAVYFDNPDLPETRSEMALPLQVRGEIIGALDVQSREPGAFTEEDVAVLQTLADQVAVAISNARLLQQAQEALESTRRAYSELGRRAWIEWLRTEPQLEQRYDPHHLLPSDGRWREEMKQAMQTGRPVLGRGDSAGTLAMPIKVRDQVIGVLDARKPEDRGEWTPEEIALLETLVVQLGAALESARLYQDIQRRATRERIIGQVAARVRQTLDVESVLKTAVQEVRQALGLPEVVVRLAPPDSGATEAVGSDQNGREEK